MENFYECIKPSVSEEQRNLVESNIFSLAEAKADGVSNPFAIYAGTQMVGFVMYDFEPKENRGYISRLMIDTLFQGQGHGRTAMEQVMNRLRQIPECREIQTAYAPKNVAAAKLRESLGFEQTGEQINSETIVHTLLGSQ